MTQYKDTNKKANMALKYAIENAKTTQDAIDAFNACGTNIKVLTLEELQGEIDKLL